MDLEALMALAASQHGVVSRAQARSLGLDHRAINRRIRYGEIELMTPIVLRFTAAPDSADQRAMAAVLDAGPGACISHDTAVARLGIPGYREDPINVWRVRNRSNHPARLGVQHKTRRLPDHHVMLLRGVPMTTPARAFVDQAAHLSLARAGRLLDELWGRNLLGFWSVDRVVGDLSRPGRTGLVLARDLLHERGPGYRPPESGLERRVNRLLEQAGMNGFDRQVDTSGDEGWIGRVDFRHRVHPLILEVQSELYHAGLSNQRADAARIRALQHAGFEVLEIHEEDVWHHPTRLIESVRRAIQRLGSERDRSRSSVAPGP